MVRPLDGAPRSAVGFHGQATSLPLRRCPPYHRSSPHQRAFNASRSLQPPPYSGAAESSCGRGIRASSHTARQCPANLCHGPLAHTPPRPRRRSGAHPFAPSQHWQAKLAALRSSKGESHGCLTAASIPHCTPAKLVRCPHRALSCQPRCQRRASPSTRPARGGGGPALTRPALPPREKLWVAMPRLPRVLSEKRREKQRDEEGVRRREKVVVPLAF